MPAATKNVIWRHATAPQNVGRVTKPTLRLQIRNQSCGDDITFTLKTNAAGVITDIRWQGNGCSFSRASASVLSEYAKGKTVAAIQTLTDRQVFALLKTTPSPARRTCALLARDVFRTI